MDSWGRDIALPFLNDKVVLVLQRLLKDHGRTRTITRMRNDQSYLKGLPFASIRIGMRQKQKPRGHEARGVRENRGGRIAYLAKTYLATFALARAAAFLCTTPDFVALSIADT